jgi:CYTH domain-containing protein
MEIERKYLISALPFHLADFDYNEIEQGYISIDPVIRIRKKNKKYYLTCKSKGLLKREELELSISEDTYFNLLKKIDYKLIKKKRYYIPLNMGLIAELDIFEDFLEGLQIAEVEFDTEENAQSFKPPHWFGKEVTFDSKFQNNQLIQLESYFDLKKDIL